MITELRSNTAPHRRYLTPLVYNLVILSQFHSGSVSVSVSESISIKTVTFDPDPDTDTDPDGLPTVKPIIALHTSADLREKVTSWIFRSSLAGRLADNFNQYLFFTTEAQRTLRWWWQTFLCALCASVVKNQCIPRKEASG